MYSNYMISDKCAFKQNKPSLAVITNNQEIKTFAQQLFNYVLDSIEDKNVEGFIKNECYIAGGCLRNFIMSIAINDIDLYFKTKDGALFFKNLFEERKFDVFKKDVQVLSETKNAITLKRSHYQPFQFVTKEAGPPQEVVYGTFDFENCMAWYDPATNYVSYDIMLNSLNTRELMYNTQSKNPLNSIKRLIKFQKMGFDITEKCLFNMFKQSKERTDIKQFNEYKLGTPAEY